MARAVVFAVVFARIKLVLSGKKLTKTVFAANKTQKPSIAVPYSYLISDTTPEGGVLENKMLSVEGSGGTVAV